VVFAVGDTGRVVPVPITVLPHEPSNHSIFAPLPSLPPLKLSVVASPLQIVLPMLEVIDVGAVGGSSTLIVKLAQAVAFVHAVFPTLLTKYVVVAVGDTGRVVPVPITVLPHEPSNHSIFAPLPPLKLSVVASPLQNVLPMLEVIDVGATGSATTVQLTSFTFELHPLPLQFLLDCTLFVPVTAVNDGTVVLQADQVDPLLVENLY
jgi:hypothetical protein